VLDPSGVPFIVSTASRRLDQGAKGALYRVVTVIGSFPRIQARLNTSTVSMAAKTRKKPALPGVEMLVSSRTLATTSVSPAVIKRPLTGSPHAFRPNRDGNSPSWAIQKLNRAAPQRVALIAEAVESIAATAVSVKPDAAEAGRDKEQQDRHHVETSGDHAGAEGAIEEEDGSAAARVRDGQLCVRVRRDQGHRTGKGQGHGGAAVRQLHCQPQHREDAPADHSPDADDDHRPQPDLAVARSAHRRWASDSAAPRPASPDPPAIPGPSALSGTTSAENRVRVLRLTA
jgi:hypothetical protein